MSEMIPGFVKLTDVHTEFNTSRKTVERRRDKAREVGDSATYRQFRLRTRNGQVQQEPSLESVKQMRMSGLVPEWFVSRTWLTKTFGKRSPHDGGQGTRPDETSRSSPSADVVTALRQQYEGTITMLRDQLAAEREEKRELLRYAQEDKKTFATVASQLAQALPALEASNRRTVEVRSASESVRPQSVDSSSRPSTAGESATENSRGWRKYFRRTHRNSV